LQAHEGPRKSKDLLVASYLCEALFERDGYTGLANGLAILRDLIAQYWETLHPDLSRQRARVAALDWLAERAVQHVSRLPVGPVDEALPVCLERIQEISTHLGPRVESGDRLLDGLRRALEEVRERSVATAPAPAAASATSPVQGLSPGPASVQSSDELDDALSAARKLLRSAGEFLRRSDPKNPLGFRLPRIGAWMMLKQAPPHTDGQTQITGYQPEDMVEKLEQMLSSGNSEAVIEETEGRFPSAVLWLDLHRFAVLALERRGDEFRPAADAIRDEVRSLLVRFPSLVDLRFANDVPLARPETRAWIRERVLAGGPTGDASRPMDARGAAAAAAAATAGDSFASARAEAWQLIGAKKLVEAVTLLEKGAASAAEFGQRVNWKLEAARVCMESGHHETALAQLDALDQELRSSTVEDWEPRFYVEVLRNLLLCRQRAFSSGGPPPAEEVTKSRELMSRLCRLDAVAALELNGKR
jgi:type VI secretion system protein VasJ